MDQLFHDVRIKNCDIDVGLLGSHDVCTCCGHNVSEDHSDSIFRAKDTTSTRSYAKNSKHNNVRYTAAERQQKLSEVKLSHNRHAGGKGEKGIASTHC